MQACPPSHELRALAEARLAPDRAVELVRHLVGCEACRALTFPGAAPVVLADTEPPRGSAGASGPDPAVTEETPGRYQVVRELGRGGQAQVFAVFDHQLGREVAMKVPHADPKSPAAQQAQTVLRFLREARITARLDHPNIVPIHEIGHRADGTYYCTQRLIRPAQDAGKVRTLRAALAEARTAQARLLLLPNFVAVCNAIAHAHSRGVLHRDLKPDNVVIGALGETVVLDWGLARLREDPVEQGIPTPRSDDGVVSLIGHVMGTPSYMSPEQALGAHDTVTERSDVWSLGAMLYELLTGYPPFLGSTPQEVLTRVKAQPVVPVLSQNRDAPPPLAAVAMKALRREPALRYGSAEALASEVSAWLADLPVRAYRYTLLEHGRLFVARHRTATAVGLVGLALVGFATGLVLRNYQRARSALAEVFVSRARVAEERLQWDAAAAYYAAARVQEDRADARFGAMLAANRSEVTVRRLVGHTGSVLALARSPDGLTLASASFDRTVRLWDPKTGQTKRILSGHQGTVNGVAFSPDGRYLATSSEDLTARLWDLDAGTPGEVIARSTDAFDSVAFSPDSQRVALGGEDRQVRLVTLADRAVHSSGAPDGGSIGHAGPVYGVAFTRDGERLISASWDNTTRVWSADGGFELLAKLAHHKDAVLSVKVSPGGDDLVTTSRDGTVLLYQLKHLEQPELLDGHTQKVYAADFSPSSGVVATGGTDRSVRLWTAGPNHGAYVGPNWRTMVSASYRGDREVNAVAFLSDGVVASAGRGGDIFLRQFLTPPATLTSVRIDAVVPLVRRGLLAYVSPKGFALRPLGALDAAADVTEDLGALQATRALAVTPDEQTLVSSCGTGQLCWVDLESRALLGKTRFTVDAEISASAFSPDGKTVAVSMPRGPVAIVDAASRRLVTSLVLEPIGAFSVAFSPDGTLLATGGYDKRIRLWSTTTWQQLRLLEGHEHGIRRVVFSPDGALLASASWDSSVRLWEVATGKAVATLDGHQEQVCAVAFSPDGKVLASGGWDGVLRLWSVADRTELARFVSDEGRIWSIAFAPDGKGLYYAGLALHRLDFKPLGSPGDELARALAAGGFRLEGANLLR